MHRLLRRSNEQRRVQQPMPGMLLTFPGSCNEPCFSTSFSPPFVHMKKKKKARDFSSSVGRRLVARYSFPHKKLMPVYQEFLLSIKEKNVGFEPKIL